MKATKSILYIIIGLTFLACNSKTESRESLNSLEKIKASTINQKSENFETSTSKNTTQIKVKNKSDYSEKFLIGLKELAYTNIELIDSLLIIGKTDTVFFSTTPQLGQKSVYTGKKDNLEIVLTVKRINYTTVEYNIEMVDFESGEHNQTGRADISPSFFFGTESDLDDQTSEGYFVTEYSDSRDKDCYLNIRLGDENNLGKIIKNCNGNITDITLDNFTTLQKNKKTLAIQ